MSIGPFHLIVAMPKKHLRHFINCIWTCIMHVLDNLQKSQKPWLTDAVKSSIKLKNKLYMKDIKNKTVYNENTNSAMKY